ncbi:MAG: hypothetical protein II938_00070 [Alphaproteobacteria bacterium]|nr:hypothetical protein [Alphaproteobacteria bacterium]
MKKLLHIWARLKRLKWQDIRRLMVLCLTAFLLAAGLTGLDISVTSLLLERKDITGLGFNYLLAAFGMAASGVVALRLERRRGFGVARTSLIMTVLLGMMVCWIKHYPSQIGLDIIFAAKYGVIFLWNIAFWSLAKRYIDLSMSSLKFLGVLIFQTLGMGLGAILAQKGMPIIVLEASIICVLFVTILFKILGLMIVVPKETFIHKIGGVQDVAERVIVDAILAISFCWTFLYALAEFQVYARIVESGENPQQILGMIFKACSVCTLIGLIFLSQTRFLYTMRLGLCLCAVSSGICALGSLVHIDELVYAGAILFFVTSNFYILPYLSLLPRPLAQGKGMRLKKMRWLIMRPCAFILLGSLLLTVPAFVLDWILMGGMIILLMLFVVSAHLYGRQLLKMCSLRMWCGAPVMLSYPPLKQMIEQGLSKTNPAEAIYFLNMLHAGYTGSYRRLLFSALNHPAVSVRLLALNKMMKLGLTLKEKRQLSHLMTTDSNEEVKNMALALLITDALESQGNAAWHKYKEYLQDKKWVWGACAGFLSGRGAWLDKIISKVLELANSTKEKDNLIALSIMNLHPRTEWIDPVERLLNKSDASVVRAALVAAGKLKAPALLNRFLPMLDEVRWRDPVLETLNEYGKQAFPIIEKMIISETAPLERQRELVLFLGRLPSGEGKQILLRTLFSANRLLRLTIIESLGDSEIVWVHKDRRNILEKAIRTAVLEWEEINKMLVHAENLEDKNLVETKILFQEALREELNRTRCLILDQIALYTKEPLALKAVEALKGTDFNIYAGAASCLQDILSRVLYKEVYEVLLYPTVNEPPRLDNKMPVGVFLNRFILNPVTWTNAWLQALALYGWRRLEDAAGLIAVKEGLKARDWIVLEAALSALGKLEKDKAKAQEMVLNIPTQYLLQQDFEKLLEEKYVSHH